MIRLRFSPAGAYFTLAFSASILACFPVFASTIPYTAVDLYTLGNAPGLSSLPLAPPMTAVEGQVLGVGAPSGSSGSYAPLVWDHSSTPTQLTPLGQGGVNATNGVQQAGYVAVITPTSTLSHAAIWNGTAAPVVDLNPMAWTSSIVFGMNGTQQVGSARSTFSAPEHAMLWSGSAASAIDLQPVQFTEITGSRAIGTNGSQQVGVGFVGNNWHAMLWNGSAASAVDLQPLNGYGGTVAYSTSGTQQVGQETDSLGRAHALLWTGTAASIIALDPFYTSSAYFTNGTLQVGYAYDTLGKYERAALWSGSAASEIDLSSVLPPGYTTSVADYIDASGNIFGYAFDSQNHGYAYEWVPVPEPVGSSCLAIAIVGLALRRNRN